MTKRSAAQHTVVCSVAQELTTMCQEGQALTVITMLKANMAAKYAPAWSVRVNSKKKDNRRWRCEYKENQDILLLHQLTFLVFRDKYDFILS